MVIDLFDKGKGLQCLKSIYHLSDEQLKHLEDKVFEYENPPMTEEQIEETIAVLLKISGESEESLQTTRLFVNSGA